MDLVLSSGFLAFAAQAGFLQGVEDAGLRNRITGICGTSSGALAGSLWAAGHSGEDIYRLLTERTPWSQIEASGTPWRGLFTLRILTEQLNDWLPERFEDLAVTFAAGTVCDGRPKLLTAGPLSASVAASCAVPWLFTPVEIYGKIHSDGGAADRLFLSPWQAIRGPRSTVVHLIERSAGAANSAPSGPNVTVVQSPRSGARLWDLGDARGRFERSRAETREHFLNR